jgi:hypothetical protein
MPLEVLALAEAVDQALQTLVREWAVKQWFRRFPAGSPRESRRDGKSHCAPVFFWVRT